MIKEANANLILEFIKANKMTIKDFCEQSKIGTTTYYNIIHGKAVRIDKIYFIAKTMKVDVTELFKEN